MDMDALSLWKDIKATFWSEKFWFPKNLTWESLENKDDGIYHPQLNDLYLVLPIALFLMLFRIFLERYVFCPLGKNLGLKEEKFTRPVYYKALENAYRLNRRPCNGLVQGLAKQTDLSIRQVERWFRIRRNQDKASVLKKFVESGWRCTFYSAIFTYGIIMLFDKVWLWKPVNCWEGYPHHLIINPALCIAPSLLNIFTSDIEHTCILCPMRWSVCSSMFDSIMSNYDERMELWRCSPEIIARIISVSAQMHVSNDIYWFYITELAFYLSSLALHFSDVRRKDFWELFIHHIITILLLTFSWIQNMIRIGTLVLVIHDTIDPIVESAKMAKYLGKQNLCDMLFVGFASIWFITRLVIFPWKIVYTTLFMAHPIVGFCPGWYVYNILLLTLQFLHVKWFFVICRVAVHAIRTGKTEDLRSETEEEVSDESSAHVAATQKSG